MKKILLISHCLSYSGAPYSTLRMAKCLIHSGYDVEVWSQQPGEFEEEFIKSNICVKNVSSKQYNEDYILDIVKTKDLVIAQTIVTYTAVIKFQYLVPTIWIIREARSLLTFFKADENRKLALERAKNVYCVSEYAKEFVQSIRNAEVKILHNYVDDEANRKDLKEYYKVKEVVRFTLIGTIDIHKSQVKLLEAYRNLPESYRCRSEIHFVGKENEEDPYNKLFLDMVNNTRNVVFHGEIHEREKLLGLIKSSDIIVVISEDEACSLVVLEAAMLSKPIIVNENIGAKYMVDMTNGWVVKKDDRNSLISTLEEAIDCGERLELLGKVSREKYEEYASCASYEKKLKEIVEDSTCNDIKQYETENYSLLVNERCFWKDQDRYPYNFIFNNLSVIKEKKIIVYGMGKVGRAFWDFAFYNKICELVGAVDKNGGEIEIRDQKLAILTGDQIEKCQYDYIVVCVLSKMVYLEILASLKKRGITEEKILWVDPTGKSKVNFV